MTEQVLDILKLALLGLLYLFFARVLWAVWSEVRRPAAADMRVANPTPTGAPRPAAGRRATKPPSGRRGTPARLAVLEPADRAGIVYALDQPLTFGRDDSNIVVLGGDNFVSGHHARVAKGSDGVVIDDLGSRNGTFLNGTRLTRQHHVAIGDRIQIGYTVLEAQ